MCVTIGIILHYYSMVLVGSFTRCPVVVVVGYTCRSSVFFSLITPLLFYIYIRISMLCIKSNNIVLNHILFFAIFLNKLFCFRRYLLCRHGLSTPKTKSNLYFIHFMLVFVFLLLKRFIFSPITNTYADFLFF